MGYFNLLWSKCYILKNFKLFSGFIFIMRVLKLDLKLRLIGEIVISCLKLFFLLLCMLVKLVMIFNLGMLNV